MDGVAATDWSWSPLLADFDNDGIKDLFIANGIKRRPTDMDYISFISNILCAVNVASHGISLTTLRSIKCQAESPTAIFLRVQKVKNLSTKVHYGVFAMP